MKKIFLVFCCVLACVTLNGCEKKVAHINGSLENLMAKLYEGIPEENLPMMLQNIELTGEDIEYYIGTKDIKWDSAIASESGVGSIAHSVVLIRMSSDATLEDIEKAKELIEENANPRKWLCVEAEEVEVEDNGDLIVLIMSDSKTDTIESNFEKLK